MIVILGAFGWLSRGLSSIFCCAIPAGEGKRIVFLSGNFNTI